MPIAAQVTNTPVHVTSASSGMTVNSAILAAKKINSLEVKYEPGLLASAATGSIDIDVNGAQVIYHSSASANFSFNFRGDSSTTLANTLEVGHTATVSIVINNGSTAYYCTSVKIDGSTKTVKWAGGSAPTAGNASTHDIYTFNIIKTASTPTYLILGSLGGYA